MITTERSYAITRAAAAKFRAAIVKAENTARPPNVHPKAHQASLEALRAQLADLERDLKAYERMKRGDATFEPAPLESIGQLLIQARITRGWKQRELADRVGVAEQQIQMYEQTGYVRASLTRLREVAQALGATVTTTIALVALPRDFTTSERSSRAPSGSHRRQPRRRRPASVSS
jgi:HTH-type transcriptional regulator/antitoxin HigA